MDNALKVSENSENISLNLFLGAHKKMRSILSYSVNTIIFDKINEMVDGI